MCLVFVFIPLRFFYTHRRAPSLWIPPTTTTDERKGEKKKKKRRKEKKKVHIRPGVGLLVYIDVFGVRHQSVGVLRRLSGKPKNCFSALENNRASQSFWHWPFLVGFAETTLTSSQLLRWTSCLQRDRKKVAVAKRTREKSCVNQS